MSLKEDALQYHFGSRPGKIEVVSTKPCATQRDLSLAYTPGVAEPCLEIAKNPEDAYKYTARGNLVAVITNGTAVLGLGDIGALAGKPVMEGKGVLFKRFADIDVFDIEVDTRGPRGGHPASASSSSRPSAASTSRTSRRPSASYIEETLKKTMQIPVFHDDQHGTAIISGAALLNALEITGKQIEEIQVVVSGRGRLGHRLREVLRQPSACKPENVMHVDTKGVIYKGRTEGMNPYKEQFARDTKARTLADALKGADVFLGLSGPNLLEARVAEDDGQGPDRLRHGQPGPGDHLPGRGRPRARTSSWPPAAATTPTRSTTSSASRSSSAARSTAAPRRSTRR